MVVSTKMCAFSRILKLVSLGQYSADNSVCVYKITRIFALKYRDNYAYLIAIRIGDSTNQSGLTIVSSLDTGYGKTYQSFASDGVKGLGG